MNTGVNEHMAHDLYKKIYTQLEATQKKNCDANSIERITAIILFVKANNKCFGKRQKEVHNDHLKNQEKGISSYQRTIAGILRLLTNHSEVK